MSTERTYRSAPDRSDQQLTAKGQFGVSSIGEVRKAQEDFARDVASRQHRFRNRKKLTNKVEVRIVCHGPVTLWPRWGRL